MKSPRVVRPAAKTEGDALGHSYVLRACGDYEHEEVCARCEMPKEGSREAHTLNEEYACECGFSPEAIVTEIAEHERLVELYNASGVLIKESREFADGSSHGS